MLVRVVRPFLIKGERQDAGTELDLALDLAREVVFRGVAVAVKVPPPVPPKAEEKPEPTRKPMTTKTAPALAGGKGD